MLSGNSHLILEAFAYASIALAWIVSLRWLWSAATKREGESSVGWRWPLAGLMSALGAVSCAIYRDVRVDPVEVVWEAQLTRLAFFLLALAFPVAIAVIEVENSGR